MILILRFCFIRRSRHRSENDFNLPESSEIRNCLNIPLKGPKFTLIKGAFWRDSRHL